MKSIRKVLGLLKQADSEFNLINNGDRIVVGVSGGKDSMLLIYALHLYRFYSKINYEIIPVILDLGFDGFDSVNISKFISTLKLELIVEDSREVYKVLKEHQVDNKHLPCSICSKMKKAAINDVARKLNANKVAFAHHIDDAIETLFMNQIFNANPTTFAPKMLLDRSNITFIRPLIFLDEQTIIDTVKQLELPILKSGCPADKHTSREDIKKMLKCINKDFIYSKDNLITMFKKDMQPAYFNGSFEYKLNNEGLYYKKVISFEDHKTYLEMYKPFEDYLSDNLDGRDETMLYRGEPYIVYLNNGPIGIFEIIVRKITKDMNECSSIELITISLGKTAQTLLTNHLYKKYQKEIKNLIFSCTYITEKEKSGKVFFPDLTLS